MRVLVLGCTGMVGTHFMKSYRQEGHEVYGIARNSASSRMAAVQDDFILRCDILERDSLAKIFREINPDIIIHMAAQAFNGVSWEAEYTTHMTNYIGIYSKLNSFSTHQSHYVSPIELAQKERVASFLASPAKGRGTALAVEGLTFRRPCDGEDGFTLDYIDVRDGVKAMRLLIDKGTSSQPAKIRDISRVRINARASQRERQARI